MTGQGREGQRRSAGRRAVSRRDVLKMAFLRVPERSGPEVAPAAPRPRPAQRPRAVVRPPGAVEPNAFAERCTGCGDCVGACPFEAIRMDDAGLPFMEPASSPCLSCLDVPCASSCDAHALEPVAHPASIRMGTAVIDPDRCLAMHGEACTTCFDACPFRHRAIRLQGVPAAPIVSPTLCTGCGVCAHLCPEHAVAVEPPSRPSHAGGAP